MKPLKHKGYVGSSNISHEDNCLFGKIEFINDLVTYEGQTPEELKAAFIEAVDDYIETCKELGQEPEKPFKGSFNVRLGPDLHKRAALKAKQENISLNQLIIEAVEKALEPDKSGEPIHLHHHEHKYIAPIAAWEYEPEKGDDAWATDPQKH